MKGWNNCEKVAEDYKVSLDVDGKAEESFLFFTNQRIFYNLNLGANIICKMF